jgi:predicted MFS family arabinose efflux permease
MEGETHGDLTRSRLVLLAAACGAAAANIYYNQPMLGAIAGGLRAQRQAIGLVPTATQVGFALGLLLLLPLGDRIERRRLILAMTALLCVFLLAASLAPSLITLAVASLLVGSMASLAQQIIAFGSQLARPAEQGKAVGSLMSGLLLGVLLARTLSGFVTAYLGWRAMFLVAALIMSAMIAILARSLPARRPLSDLSYPRLLRSLLSLVRAQPVLRESSAIGAMLFGAFSAFWSTLALLLEGPPFHLHSAAAGLFGLVGAIGAMAAPVAGRLSDRGHSRRVLWVSGLAVTLAFVILGVFARSLAGLVAGVILLDLGVWAAQIANQQRIFATSPEARGRINAVYMVCYFAGGATGSALGSFAWNRGGWPRVALVGGLMASISLAVLARGEFAVRRGPATTPDLGRTP